MTNVSEIENNTDIIENLTESNFEEENNYNSQKSGS